MAWSGGFQDFGGDTRGSRKDEGFYGATPMIGPGGDAYPSADGYTKIADLAPGVSSTKIVGIVIAKEDARHFPSKRDPSQECYVMSFTVRDLPTDFINATCWGGEQLITTLANTFHIGDVVEISHAGIQSKPVDGSDEKFHPSTPSMYQLNISESRGSVNIYTGWDVDGYNNLLHIPVKASNDFYTIHDILANGQSLHGEHLNLLAAVRRIGPVREMTSKTGKPLKRREIKLFDETAPSFALILWDEESINLSHMWIPKDIVLFAADVRVTYDDFRKTMIATVTGKTVLTVNPDTKEAHSLYRYAQSADLGEDDTFTSGSTNQNVDLESINEVYTVEGLKEKQREVTPDGAEPLYGIVFAFITSCNLDGHISSVLAVRCSKCKFRVDSTTQSCTNQNCPRGIIENVDTESTETETTYDIKLSISDHTGSLDTIRVTGEVAEKMLGCSVSEFMSLGVDEKTELKWKFLLEKCKIYIKMIPPSYDRMRPVTRILSCNRANPDEAARYLK